MGSFPLDRNKAVETNEWLMWLSFLVIGGIMNKINLAEEYGTCLSSRHAAKELRSRILKNPNVWEIDFRNVYSISHSFADECFAMLVQSNNTEWFANNIKFINLENDNIRNQILEAIFIRINANSHG